MTETTKETVSTIDWKQRIYDWLAEEGLFRKEVDDPKATFHFQVNYPVGSPYHIELVKPRDMKDGILILAILRVMPPHYNALAKLSPDKRRELIFDLRMQLLPMRPAFSVKEKDDVWEAIQFQLRLLNDTLSKTRLLEGLYDVFRSMLMVIWTFGYHFGIPTDSQQPGFYT